MKAVGYGDPVPAARWIVGDYGLVAVGTVGKRAGGFT